MAVIYGLFGTEDVSGERFKNHRQAVFHNYPNGEASLTGILSMLGDENTDDPEFYWHEKRLRTMTTLTATQPWHTDSGATTELSDGGTLTAGTTYYLLVDDASLFREGHVIEVRGVEINSAASTADIQLRVTSVNTSTNVLGVIPLATQANVDNDTADSNDKVVIAVGSAHEQGARSKNEGGWQTPVRPGNYTQIFRTPFSFTGTVLKTGLKFDRSGPYKEKAKEHSIGHMSEIERAILFGNRSVDTDGDDGLPVYTTGGLIWFLKQWELQNTTNGGAFDYVTGASAATADTDDAKRIIENSGGTISESQFEDYMERLFRVTSNKGSEKLCLCGNGFLANINRLYKGSVSLNSDKTVVGGVGVDIVSLTLPWGRVHFKTHAMFNHVTTMRNNGLFLDVHNLRWRYMMDRDTKLLKNRQENDADKRKDEWLTEAGLEVRFPESHMYLKNVTGIRK